MTPAELEAIADKWLQLCGLCDAGLPMSCTCPDGDYRTPMLDLITEIRLLHAAFAK